MKNTIGFFMNYLRVEYFLVPYLLILVQSIFKVNGNLVFNGKLVNINENLIIPSVNPQLCKENPCGTNAECLNWKDFSVCRCLCGFYGDPYLKCNWMTPTKAWRIAAEIFYQINSSNIAYDLNFTTKLNEISSKFNDTVLSILPGYIKKSLFFEFIR